MNGADLVAQLERLHDLVVADATHLDVVGTFGDLKRRLHNSQVTLAAIYSQRCHCYTYGLRRWRAQLLHRQASRQIAEQLGVGVAAFTND
jgi:hypothetical protein